MTPVCPPTHRTARARRAASKSAPPELQTPPHLDCIGAEDMAAAEGPQFEFVPIGWALQIRMHTHALRLVDVYDDSGAVRTAQCVRKNRRHLAAIGGLAHDHIRWRWGQGLASPMPLPLVQA